MTIQLNASEQAVRLDAKVALSFNSFNGPMLSCTARYMAPVLRALSEQPNIDAGLKGQLIGRATVLEKHEERHIREEVHCSRQTLKSAAHALNNYDSTADWGKPWGQKGPSKSTLRARYESARRHCEDAQARFQSIKQAKLEKVEAALSELNAAKADLIEFHNNRSFTTHRTETSLIRNVRSAEARYAEAVAEYSAI